MDAFQPPIATGVGRRIKFIRQLMSISQDELSDAIHVPREGISEWEMGFKEPSLKDIRALSEYLLISTEDIFCFDERDVALRYANRLTQAMSFDQLLAICQIMQEWAGE